MIALQKAAQPVAGLLRLRNRINKPKSKHLYPLTFRENSLPLFIIPGAGGKTDMFGSLCRVLKRACTIYGLDMMGTQRGETPLDNIPEIAAQNIRWIREVQPEGPYRFLGHSFGAYVMYEMVQQLEAAGDVVDFIAVLDQDIKWLEGFPEEDDRIGFLMRLSRDYYQSFRILAPPYPDWSQELRSRLETRSMKEMIPCIAAFAGQQFPHRQHRIEYVSRLINIRHYNASITYHLSGTIKTNVIILKGTAIPWDSVDETLGWSGYAGNVKVYDIPGNHHNIVKGDNIILLARCLFQYLDVIIPSE
jgi:thioesterase domain-containing protein